MLRIGIPVQYEGAETIATHASEHYECGSGEAKWLSYLEAVRRSGAQPIPSAFSRAGEHQQQVPSPGRPQRARGERTHWHPEELARRGVGGDAAAPDVQALFSALAEAARLRGALRS